LVSIQLGAFIKSFWQSALKIRFSDFQLCKNRALAHSFRKYRGNRRSRI